jgi:nucleotide-binding universal stress UspA family protein
MSVPPFPRSLVGFDGSAAAAQALTLACQLAGADAEVVALAVLELDPSGDQPRRRPDPRLIANSFDDVVGRLAIKPQLRMITGERAGPAIADYAEVHGFELVVLGPAGMSLRSSPVTAEALLRAGGRAVLVVPSQMVTSRRPGDQFLADDPGSASQSRLAACPMPTSTKR